MSSETPEVKDASVNPGAPQLVGAQSEEEKKKKDAARGQSSLTQEQRDKLESFMGRMVEYASHMNPAFGKMFKLFKAFGSDHREIRPTAAGLGDVLKKVEEVATKANPTPADLARYPGLKPFDGKPETLEANTRAIMQHLIDDKTLRIDATQKQAILDHIPAMVKDGYVNGSYNIANMAKDMESFIRSHGNASVDFSFRLDAQSTQAKITGVDGMFYGKAVRASDLRGGFMKEMDIESMDSHGAATYGGPMMREALIKELGGKLEDLTVQAVHKVDKSFKVEAGKTPPEYVVGYWVENSKTHQGYYLTARDSINLMDVSDDPKKRKQLVDDLLKTPEVAVAAPKPDTPAPLAALENTVAMNATKPAGPGLN